MFLFSMIFSMFMASSVDIEQVVDEFHLLKTKNQELEFIRKYKNSKNKSILVYVISARMKQAEYTMNPIKKLQIFHANKRQLDWIIKKNPANIHGHYIRLVIQERMPRLVGYYHEIATDKKAVKYLLSFHSNLSYLKKYIKLNTSL